MVNDEKGGFLWSVRLAYE